MPSTSIPARRLWAGGPEVAVLGLADAAEAHRRLEQRPAPNKLLLDLAR